MQTANSTPRISASNMYIKFGSYETECFGFNFTKDTNTLLE